MEKRKGYLQAITEQTWCCTLSGSLVQFYWTFQQHGLQLVPGMAQLWLRLRRRGVMIEGWGATILGPLIKPFAPLHLKPLGGLGNDLSTVLQDIQYNGVPRPELEITEHWRLFHFLAPLSPFRLTGQMEREREVRGRASSGCPWACLCQSYKVLQSISTPNSNFIVRLH